MPLGRSVLGREALARFDLLATSTQGATSPLKGNAAIRYNDPDDGTVVTFRLNWPLENAPQGEMTYGHRQRRWTSDSVDFSDRAVFSTSGGVYWLQTVARFETDIQGLLDAVEASRRGQEVKYLPDANSTGTAFPVRFGGDVSTVVGEADEDRYGLGERQVQVVMERTDGSDLSNLFST